MLLLLVSGAASNFAQAQYSRDPALNQTLRQLSGIRSMGDMIVEGLQAGAEVRNLMQDAHARIAEARKRHWAAYPNRPGFEAAKREYEAALHSKDFFYLSQAVIGTTSVVNMLGGQVDKGIHRAARTAFDEWVNEVKRNLGGDAGLLASMSDVASAREKINRAEPQYRQYVLRRNLEEYRLQGRTPPGMDPEAWRIAVIGAPMSVDSDPYITAFTAVAERRTFVARCPAEVSTILRKPLTAAQCGCVHGVVKSSAPPLEAWNLETQFNETNLILALVSAPGMADKVASCIRN